MAYKLIAELGRGGMGTVFRARHVELNRDVAIKFVGGTQPESASTVDRFLREMRVLQGLSHPGIVRFLDAGVARERPYLVMELLEGCDLGFLLKQAGAMPVTAALDIVVQLLDAIGFVHERGLVHRDIKPANVMVDPRGRAVLTDFGLVKKLDSTVVTQLGHAVGTLLYIAPEIIEGQSAEAPADIWACGALFYEMLAGRPAFDASTVGEAVTRILDSEPPALDLLRTDLPQALTPILKRFLEKDVKRRWPDAQAARAALLELQDALEAGVEPVWSTLAGQVVQLEQSASVPGAAMVDELVEPQLSTSMEVPVAPAARSRSSRKVAVAPSGAQSRPAPVAGVPSRPTPAGGVVSRPTPASGVPSRPRTTRRTRTHTVDRALEAARMIVAVLAVAVAVLAAVVFRKPGQPEVATPVVVPVRSPVEKADTLVRAARNAPLDARHIDELWLKLRREELEKQIRNSEYEVTRALVAGDRALAGRLERAIQARAEPVAQAWADLRDALGPLLADAATPREVRRDLLETLDRLDALDAVASYLGLTPPFDVLRYMQPAVTVSEYPGPTPPLPPARLQTLVPEPGQLGPLVFLKAELLDRKIETYVGDFVIGTKERFRGKPRVHAFFLDLPAADAQGVLPLHVCVRSLWPNMRMRFTNPEGAAISVRFPNGSKLPSSRPNWFGVKLTGALVPRAGRWTVTQSRAFQTSQQMFYDVDRIALER